MALHRFATVDVFTRQRFGGNPLAVFPQAAGIAEADLQRLSAELNLSETTFVLPPRDPANTARVRIFNRSHEMPFAGHPMVGTAFVLASLERNPPGAYTFEVPSGLVEVKLRKEEGKVRGAVIEAPQPLKIGLDLPVGEVASAAGLDPEAVLTANHPPLLASVGNTYVIAEVGREALEKASPDLAAFRLVRQKYEGLENRFSLYLYARSGDEIHARMFAPLAGTWEDPATGSAATPLAALLLQLSGGDRAEFAIYQGKQMGRPSLLETAAWRTTDGIRASVGGDCVPVLRGEAEL
jgi:trans-2,3-dihydro-3-hydroxyanthranilate isomerase